MFKQGLKHIFRRARRSKRRVVRFARYFRFVLMDKLYTGSRDAATLFLRASKPDSDTVPLIEFLDKQSGCKKIYLATKDKEATAQFIEMLERFAVDTPLTMVNQAEIHRALMRSRVVCLKNGYRDAPGLRSITGKRVVLFHDHGLVTKLPTSMDPRGCGAPPFRILKRQPEAIRVAQGYLHAYVIAAIIGSPSSYGNILPLGYPRFYRAKQLLANPRDCVVSAEGKRLLDSFKNRKKILWAPHSSTQ